MFCKPGAPFRPQFLPWLGALPVFFKQLRGILISKAVACRDLGLTTPVAAIALIEALLELIRLQYPAPLVRALIHSVPRSSSVVLARRIFRVFVQHLAAMGKQPYGSGKGATSSANGGGFPSGGYSNGDKSSKKDSYRQDRSRGRDRRKQSKSGKERHKAKSSSSSSSSSESTHAKRSRKTKQARRLLTRADADYRAFLEEKERRAQEEHYRQQGELLANALSSKFDASIQAAAAAGARTAAGTQGPGHSPFPPTPPGGPPAGGDSAEAPDGFSPGQLAQIRQMFAEAMPAATPPGKTPKEDEPGKKGGPLSALQLAYLNSMSQGKVSLVHGEGYDEFHSRVVACWSNRAIVDALGDFIKQHAPAGTATPKPKVDRTKLFWELLLDLH